MNEEKGMDSQIANLIKDGKKLAAIKICQDSAGISFSEAKSYVEDIENKIELVVEHMESLKKSDQVEPTPKVNDLSSFQKKKSIAPWKIVLGTILGLNILIGLIMLPAYINAYIKERKENNDFSQTQEKPQKKAIISFKEILKDYQHSNNPQGKIIRKISDEDYVIINRFDKNIVQINLNVNEDEFQIGDGAEILLHPEETGLFSPPNTSQPLSDLRIKIDKIIFDDGSVEEFD